MTRYRADDVYNVILADRIGRPGDFLLEQEKDERGPTGFFLRAIETEADYREFAIRRLKEQGKPPVLTERAERPAAYISDGRWVIDCDCRSGAAAWPEVGIAICCACGSVYRPVFPADWRVAERHLLGRPSPHSRHYLPNRETATDLLAENAARGIGRT